MAALGGVVRSGSSEKMLKPRSGGKKEPAMERSS